MTYNVFGGTSNLAQSINQFAVDLALKQRNACSVTEYSLGCFTRYATSLSKHVSEPSQCMRDAGPQSSSRNHGHL